MGWGLPGITVWERSSCATQDASNVTDWEAGKPENGRSKKSQREKTGNKSISFGTSPPENGTRYGQNATSIIIHGT
jgi:hypothetical protein